jgi:hypothetical protein
VDGEEFGFRAKARSTDGVPKTHDDDEHSAGFDVHAWRDDLAEILVDHKQREDEPPEHHDRVGQRSAHATRIGMDDDAEADRDVGQHKPGVDRTCGSGTPEMRSVTVATAANAVTATTSHRPRRLTPAPNRLATNIVIGRLIA